MKATRDADLQCSESQNEVLGGLGVGASRTVRPTLLSYARSMRRAPTPAERKLWRKLRNHQSSGLKFRRQVPLGPYIADFYYASAKLVVEVDGVSHIDAPDDAIRDEWMRRQGLRIFRVTNFDVFSNLEGIVNGNCSSGRRAPSP